MVKMRLPTLEMIFMAFITITEEGRVDENTLDSRISEEATKDMPASESVKDNSVDTQENNIENQDELLFSNKMDFENKKKYAHHRGNRKYFADNYGEEHSDFSDNNFDGEEADVYSKMDESSEEYLDSSILSNINNKATEYYTKESGKSINNEKKNMNMEIYDNNQQEKILENVSSLNTVNVYKNTSEANNPTVHSNNHDYMEDSVNQHLLNEEKVSGIIEESDEFENDNDDESYILPDVESFWDAVDTFIKLNPYSENHEMEDSEDPEELYDYLYTPSGNAPGIDQFLDLLHFVKDVDDAIKRIEKDIKWTSEKDPDVSSLYLSNNEVDEMMTKKEENHISYEGHKINKNAEKINSSSNRSKRSDMKESDNGIKTYQHKTYQHKPFGTGIGMKFPLFKFDLFFTKLIFEPFVEPFPDDE